MRKKISGSLAVFAAVAVAAFNIHVNTNDDNGMTALSLANVEALADDEGGGFGHVWVITYLSPTSHRCDKGGLNCCPDLPC